MTPVVFDCGHKDIFFHEAKKGDSIFCVACQQQRIVKEIPKKDSEVE